MNDEPWTPPVTPEIVPIPVTDKAEAEAALGPPWWSPELTAASMARFGPKLHGIKAPRINHPSIKQE